MSKMKIILILFLFFQNTAQAGEIVDCAGKFNYSDFSKNWNLEFKKIKTGTWQIPTQQPRELLAGNKYRQSLYGPNLYISFNFDAKTCFKSIEILARRDRAIAMQSMVAWLNLVKILNPELSSEKRKKLFGDLGLWKPEFKAGGTQTINGNKYTFSENFDGNLFIATRE